jgi:hypothetical protein
MRRGRLAVLWLAGTMVAMSLGATFLLGIDVHLEYLTSVLPSHLAGATLDDYAVTFQSFRTLYNRYYIPHPEFNLSAPYDWAAGGQIMLIATQFIVLGALLIGLRRLGATSGPGDRPTPFSDDERICLHLSLLTVVTLLLSPGSATYHFIILAIPAALALRCGASFRRIGLPLQIAILAAAGIGFLPYSVFRTFENSGMLMALAYPRLLALMVIFSGILCYIMIRVRKNH